MKRIVIILIGLIGVAYGQGYAPTSAKTRFVNGIALGTKLDSYFAAADSNAIYWRADSALMAKYKGTARRVVFSGELGSYLPISDTAAMLSNYRRKTTLIENADLRNSAITINGSSTSLGGSINVGTVTSVATGVGLSGGTITTSGTISADTTTLSTRAYVTGQLVGYATTGNLALKLNISDTASMLSNYRRKTTLIENTDLRNSAITINGSSTALGGSISVGTVTSVAASAGTGISVSGSPITSSGTLTITNTAPDQTVTLTAGTGISVSGTYPNFTVTNTSPSSGGTVTSVSAGTGMSFTTITSSGAVNADTTTLATRAYAAGLDVAKANTSLNNVNGVLSSTYGGAGSVSGILKANGSGVVSAAVAGTDYVIPSALNSYLPLAGGTLSGSLSGTNFAVGARSTSNSFQLPDWRIYNTSGGNLAFNDFTADRLTLSPSTLSLSVALSGTSLSMSGIGLFNGAVDDGTNKLIVNGGVKGTTGKFGGAGANAALEVQASTGEVFRADAASGAPRIVADQSGVLIGGSLGLTYGQALYFNGLANQYVTADASNLYLGTANSPRLTISTTGAATFSSSVRSTNLLVNTGTNDGWISVNGDNSGRVFYAQGGSSFPSGNSLFRIDAGGQTPFEILGSGAATFSGQINGTSLSMSGGGSFGTTLGVGIASPSNTLHVKSASDATLRLEQTSSGYATISSGDFGIMYLNADAGNLGSGSSMRFLLSGSEKSRITQDGTFLIGTTTTDGTNKLIVNGGVKGNRYYATGTGFASATSAEIALQNTTATTGRTFVVNSTDAGEFQVFDATAANATRFLINSTGAATFSSSVTAGGILKGVGFNQPISVKTSNYTLTSADHTVLFNNTSGNLTATLPAGVEGQIFVIGYLDANNNVTINPNGSETIGGAASFTLQSSTCLGAITLQFLSGNWYIVSTNYNASCL